MVDTGYLVPERPDTMITHRIIADSENRLWVFFQTGYGSLAFGTSGDGGKTWSPAREILPDISGPFSVSAGAGGRICLAARRWHPPDIWLLTWNGREWSTVTVLKTAGKQLVTCFPITLEDGNSLVHVVYASRHYSSGEWQASHWSLNPVNQDFSIRHLPPLGTPLPHWAERLNFLKEITFWSGDMARDSSNNLHLACRAFSGSHYQINYSFYSTGTGQWGEFTQLTRTPFHRGHPRIAGGSGGSGMHVVFQVEEENGDRLACLTRSPGGNWGAERTVADPVEKDVPPELVTTPAGPVLYWADGSGVSRAFIEGDSPVKKVLAERIASLSACQAGDRVLLALAGLQPDPQKIFLYTDCLN